MRNAANKRSEPTVDVIVPCFNYGHFVAGCADSVLAQEGVQVRVLLIDDRSTDDSAEHCRSVAAGDPRVELRLHDENRGLVATANEGLEWASGDYVALLSADDLLVPGSLRRATTVMHADMRIGMVYGRPALAREHRPLPVVRGRWRGTTRWSGQEWISRRCRSAYNCISSPEVLVRTAVQKAVGGYDPACRHATDLNMWLRIAAVADVAYVRGIPQAIYRIHRDSMLRSQSGPLEDLSERWVAFEAFFASCGERLEQAEQLRETASRALAKQALWEASRCVDRGQEAELVEEYVRFACAVDPAASRLREWNGLRLRQRIGDGRSALFPPFLATGAAHRLRAHSITARRRLRGI